MPMDNINISQSLLHAVPMPLVLIAADEYIKVVNPAANELLGQGVCGRHFATALRQPALHAAIESTFRNGTAGKSQYQRIIGDQVAIYDVRCVPVTNGNGAVLVSFEDVSPLHEADQMRSDFVANVSHELRSPLTALLGFIETLRGAARDDASARDRFLEIMEREASRMTRLVRDLLSLSKVESEERVRPNKTVDVTQVLDSCIQSLKPLAAENGVMLCLQGRSPEKSCVQGDSDQLQQVFINLIENAIKYGGQDGNVTVTVRHLPHDPRLRGPALHIDVSDHGDGIAQVHIPRLTERFYRIDSHRSREMGGTGLGLAIVKHIVNRHRGRLKITSTKGQGSTFTVILPAA